MKYITNPQLSHGQIYRLMSFLEKYHGKEDNDPKLAEIWAKLDEVYNPDLHAAEREIAKLQNEIENLKAKK